MVNPDKLKPGDRLYSTYREKAGNTTRSRMCVNVYTFKEVKEGLNGKQYYFEQSGDKWKTFAQVRTMRRSPPEWCDTQLWEYRCYLCHAKKPGPHKGTCTHPAAIRARKKAVA